jgi:hypothetical protein
MLSRFFETLYHKVFVNIVVLKSKSVVSVETLAKGGIIDSVEESFDTTTLNEKMYNFISAYTKESPYYYISLLDKTSSQGACPTCSKKNMSKYFDTYSSKHFCYYSRWAYYTSKTDLHILQKEYARIGVDFIFSSFVLLARFFKDKIDTNMAMFVLIEETYITISIFDNSKLLFAKHIDVKNDKSSDELLIEDQDSSEEELDLAISNEVDFDEVDNDELDHLGDIEDLDSLDDLDEFSDTKDIEEELNEKLDESSIHTKADTFSEDYQRFLFIQKTLNDFYKNDEQADQFIEAVYIADGIGVSGDLKRYLEEEMFLNVYIRNMDINAEVFELAKAEVK